MRRKLARSVIAAALCLSWPPSASADEPVPIPVPEPPPVEEPVVVPPAPDVIPAPPMDPIPPPTMFVGPERQVTTAPGHVGARQRGIGFTLVGLGTLTTAVGTILVLSGKSTYDDARTTVGCTDAGCPADAADRANAARSQVNAGGIVLVTGVCALAAGIVVWVTAPSSSSGAAVGIAPLPGGLSAVGRF